MKVGTKKKPIFYKVRAVPGGGETQMREGSMRNACYMVIKAKGKRGIHVDDVQSAFDKPIRTTIHKLIEMGFVEAVYPKN